MRSGVQPWSRLLRSRAIRLTLTERRVGMSVSAGEAMKPTVGRDMQVCTSVGSALRDNGFAILSTQQVMQICGSGATDPAASAAFLSSWNDLPTDEFLADGGRYRFRRHASLKLSQSGWLDEPYRPHWQPKAYNKLHGGVFRTFAEVRPETTKNATYRGLVEGFGEVFAAAAPRAAEPWFVETHQFRIDARQGEGRPTPEGAHRDGVDYVALIMLGRRDIEGAVTTVYDNNGALLSEFMLHEPFTAMLLDDQRVVHATTPFRATGPAPERDTLVVTYRAGGFLQP
ncbi:MAG: hypothetical protein EAZ43_12385 [Betaproteobacteria bacterium]|nr:MAG: hypothetical protein EAZ43_12385 [Betaproteobacteria bacterium]